MHDYTAAGAALVARTLGIGAAVAQVELGIARQCRNAHAGFHLMVTAVVFGADAVAQLVVDLFGQAQAGTVLAAGVAHPTAQPAAFAQRHADSEVDRVVLLLASAHLPLGTGR